MMIQRQLSVVDRQILDSYTQLVDALVSFLGPHCEVVLHSLELLHCSVIKIANGVHTNRREGAPITDMALQLVKQLERSEQSHVPNYITRNEGGAMMRSSTFAIRNSQQEMIGLLCINMNISAPFHEVVSCLLPDMSAIQEGSPETFASNVEQLVGGTVEKTIQEVNADPALGNQNKNKQIVQALFDKGIFDIKDAIVMVAGALGISKHTVYLYIRQYKQQPKIAASKENP